MKTLIIVLSFLWIQKATCQTNESIGDLCFDIGKIKKSERINLKLINYSQNKIDFIMDSNVIARIKYWYNDYLGLDFRLYLYNDSSIELSNTSYWKNKIVDLMKVVLYDSELKLLNDFDKNSKLITCCDGTSFQYIVNQSKFNYFGVELKEIDLNQVMLRLNFYRH